MSNLIESLESGNFLSFKNSIEDKLMESVKNILAERKLQVVANLFSKERPLTESTMNSQKPQVVTPIQDLIHVGEKFGFHPYDSKNTQFGKLHVFNHPVGGHELHLHQTRNKAFWAHHSLGEDGSYTNHGNGDTAKDLRNHLGQVFPKPEYRATQVENILTKYGDELLEALKLEY